MRRGLRNLVAAAQTLKNQGQQTAQDPLALQEKERDEKAQTVTPRFFENFVDHAAEDYNGFGVREKSRAPNFAGPETLNAKRFLENLQKHTALDPFPTMAEDDLSQPRPQLNVQLSREIVAPAATYATQISGASYAFFSAGVLSTILSEKGFKGLAAVKSDPGILTRGVSLLMVYNILATEAALSVGQSIRGEGENPSLTRVVSSILGSSAVEMAVGNPLDFYSLKGVFKLAKIEHALTNNPQLFDKLRGEKTLFNELVPKALRELPNAELAKQFSYSNLTQKQVKALGKIDAQLNISAGEWAKMNAAGATYAALRNINFYLVTHLINQSNAAAKESGGEGLSSAQITAISTAGSAITSPLNMAAYTAAFRVNEGEEVSQAMKSALKHAFGDAVKNPRIFACLVALRSAATLACAGIFSNATQEKVTSAVNAAADMVQEFVREEKSQKPNNQSLEVIAEECKALKEAQQQESPSVSPASTAKAKQVVKETAKTAGRDS